MPFEFSATPIVINGNCSIIEGMSTAQNVATPLMGGATNSVIQTDQGIDIQFSWTQAGAVGFLNGGTWDFKVYLEHIGVDGGASVDLNFSLLAQAAAPILGVQPIKTVAIAPNTIGAGIYRVVCSMQFSDGSGPKPLVGFEDLGIIQIYDEVL